MADSTRREQSVKNAPIYSLTISRLFDGLSSQEKLYAHHMARASWHGTRVVLRQTSPESPAIFDWILQLHRQCGGDWCSLARDRGLDDVEITAFLDYAACFLSNIGNYYGSGDQKFVPNILPHTLERLSGNLLSPEVKAQVMNVPPYSLGFPGKDAQSAYYLGSPPLQREEIVRISHIVEQLNILPENTRVRREETSPETSVYSILQASTSPADTGDLRALHQTEELRIILEPGDHRDELRNMCNELRSAREHAANTNQQMTLELYIQSFETGDLQLYRDALRIWVRDLAPNIEHIIGFVEPYRDPYGARAEFEGLVAIADPEETKVLSNLVQHSDAFIRKLPWCQGYEENNGKGPFEKSLFDPPDFASIHVLAYCSSIIFPGINLPNYNDIRQECGFKNVIIANRMAAESSKDIVSPFVAQEDAETFQKHKFPAYYIWVVLHELLGHGTCKLLCQHADGTYNFDQSNPPIDPLTRQPVDTWYQPGQTWTGQFEDLATTVDECRAELVGAFLMDEKGMLRLFGYTDDTEITAEDLTYNAYMQLAVDGLRGLANFNEKTQTWGQAHSRAHFATLRCLLQDGKGSVHVDFESETQKLTIRVDRTRIIPHAKDALATMLLRLHIYRSTADIISCRSYYEALSKVDGQYLAWRSAVLAVQEPKRVFVQPNTFLSEEQVTLREYDATPSGVIQSWAERAV